MNHFKAALAGLAVCVAWELPVEAQQTTVTGPWHIPDNGSIRQLLADRIDVKQQDVGLVVGIIDANGRRVVTYGRASDGGKRPLDGDTVFQIGSVTKVLTTLLLADMVQRGEVALDDPAEKYLGVDLPARGREITLRDLATHRSGLPSMPDDFDLDGKLNPYEAYTEQQLFQFVQHYQLPREPGVASEYSNLGVTLLSHALARRSGEEFETLLRQRILQPLGMQDTMIDLTARLKQRLAPGHDMYRLPVEQWNLPAFPGSGALRSTVNDMLDLLTAYLGYTRTPLAVAMENQLATRIGDGNVRQALGWQVGKVGEAELAVHDGGKPGYRSYVAFDSDAGTGVVILANTRSADRLSNLALHLLTGRPMRPTPQAPVVRKKFVAKPSQLTSITGRYRIEDGTEVTVVAKDDRLWVAIAGSGILEFYPESATTFFCNTDPIELATSMDATGRVIGLVYREGGKSQAAARLVN
jgi:serine-type D-Ala-D-Ala carboxypeptidase/endopeptidase